MKKVLIVGGIILFSSGCSDLGMESDKEKESENSISFIEDIQPIFNNNCAYEGCHVVGHIAGLDLSEGVSYSNLVNVPSIGYVPLLRVAPKDPENSVLYLKITGSPLTDQVMPPIDPLLDDSQINMIKDWILDGAPNN